MQKIKQKLKNQEGASITFALLLFLVCAVVGSVVLTAGTAASGRLSELAKMDQRYYSVTSAEEFIRSILCDTGDISFTFTKTTRYNKNADGTGSEELINTTYSLPVITSGDVSIDQFKTSLCGAFLFKSLLGFDALNNRVVNDTDWNGWTQENSLISTDFSLGDILISSAPENKSLKVKVNGDIKPDGTIVLVIENANDDTDKYRLQMNLSYHITIADSTSSTTDYVEGSAPLKKQITQTDIKKIGFSFVMEDLSLA